MYFFETVLLKYDILVHNTIKMTVNKDDYIKKYHPKTWHQDAT